MKSTPILFSLQKRRIIQTASLLLAMLFSFTALGQTANPSASSPADDAASKARAEAVLKQTRQALGGDANLAALKSLTINGDFRSAMGGREVKGDFKIEMLLPDKYQRTLRTTMGPMVLTRIETTNGVESWRDTKRDMAAAGGGGGGFGAEGGGGGGGFGGGGAGAGGGGFGGGGAGGGGGFGGGGGGGRGGGGRGGAGGGGFGVPSGGGNTGIVGEASPETQKQIKQEYSRLLVMLLAGASASSSFEYAYDRELEAKEGKVDVIRVTGKDDFVAWMMIDRRTYRPWMIVYRAMSQRQMRQPNQSPTIVGEGNTEEPKLLDYQLFFADYKQEGNVWFPHQIVRVLNNQPQEEWKLNKIKVNADIKANKFDKKK